MHDCLKNPFESVVGITTDEPVTVSHPPAGAVADSPRFELDEARFMAALMSEVELMPIFLDNPSWEYLDAERRA